jgi:predicted RecB family nuclease
VATTLPLYAGHGCHQQVLTQFSLHVRPGLDGAVEHFEYLAEAELECERELAERLVAALGEAGSIVVYSPYEKTQILRLAERFADLEEPLGRIARRLVDLLPIVMHHVYHPEFGGSFSIKKVLPALVPELSYAGLAVGDGSMAITRFAQMARGEIRDAEAVRKTRGALLEYCRLDTLAMVRLHAVLAERAAMRMMDSTT